MNKFEKLLEKKKSEGKGLSEAEKSAKSGVLKHLGSMASEAMGDHMGSHLKKVTVASDSKEGLKHGLDKAKQVVSKSEHGKMVEDAEDGEGRGSDLFAGGEESSDHEDSESPEFEAGEKEGMSEMSAEECNTPEEIDAKIKELLKKKAELEQS